MALYAISDLHLALNGEKPMDIFGQHWSKHDEKIKENWIKRIKEEDTVLIAGDISWSMKMEEGLMDLEWIHNLPGRKIISKGNHDYWWTTISKLRNLYDDMDFIQNNYYTYENWAICGTRGWICRGATGFTSHDEKIYNRENIRLTLSLEQAVKDGYKDIIVMMHYPPKFNETQETLYTETFKKYGVKKVIYGHLHGAGLKNALNGVYDGIEYIMTSCDFLDFDPIKIL